MAKAVLIDIMTKERRFICQLSYNQRGYYTKVNGQLLEVHSEKAVKNFVEKRLPSLRGSNYNVCFTNQKILN